MCVDMGTDEIEKADGTPGSGHAVPPLTTCFPLRPPAAHLEAAAEAAVGTGETRTDGGPVGDDDRVGKWPPIYSD